MIRLAVPDFERLESATSLDLSIGGTESNVAVALARLGRRVAWISALPTNPLGRRIASVLKSHGVDSSHVHWTDGSRAGIYFLEPGAAPRPTRVIYDRAQSALATIDPDAVSYDLLSHTRALHLTGITPALSDNCGEVCRRLMERAKAVDVPLIFDVNYRSLLWTPEQASRELAPFLAQVHVLFCGRGDAATIWRIEGLPEIVARDLLDRSSAELVVVTDGGSGATAVTRSGDVHMQPGVQVDIIDAVGAGDGFAAGFLDVWFSNPDDITGALRSGVALASLQMTMPGDLAIITPGELAAAIEALDEQGSEIVR